MTLYKHVALISVLLLTACGATPTTAQNQPAHNRYNVLFIAVDDLRPELGCYGQAYVRTPNIDRLAASGVVFKQHFVSVPTCGASRFSLLTGREPANSGGTSNGAFSLLKPQQQPGAQTLPELFRRSGYHTTLIGKISHTGDGKNYAYNGKGDGSEELPHAWDDYATPYGPWQRGWGIFFAYADGKHREDGGGHMDLMQFTVEKDTDLPDGLMAQRAIEKLAELKDQASGGKPFFMGLGFFKPHLPFVAPRQDWDAVQDWDVPTPAFPEGIDTAYYNGGSGEFYKYKVPWQKTKPLALEDAMQAKRAYLACVRYTDRQVGKVLDALEKEGLADNTVVVLWGDHGWFLGEAAMWAKHSALETALHSPLIIRAPGVAKPGTSTAAVASTVDIYPTLMHLCNPSFTDTAFPLDGVSLLPILTGEKDDVRTYATSLWRNATSYRTRDTRVVYTRKKDGAVGDIEMYDLGTENGAFIDAAKDDPDAAQQLIERLEKIDNRP